MGPTMIRSKSTGKKSGLSKAKLSDSERHERFLDVAKNVEASTDARNFDRAFNAVASPRRNASSACGPRKA